MALNPAQTITIWTAIVGTIGTGTAWYLSKKLPPDSTISPTTVVIAGALVGAGAGLAAGYVLSRG